MNKICTSIEQSEKLIYLGIDENTADMYWWATSKRYYIAPMDDGDFNEAEEHVPAWSLSALLYVLPNNYGRYTKSLYWFDGSWHCEYVDQDGEGYVGETADNPVDACYEMIIKLKEQKLL